MNDERFFDLAMKVIANQATDAERAELVSVVASDPQRKAELERLRTESRVLKEMLLLVEATEAKVGELPGYARSRLQSKVRRTLGGSQGREQEKELVWGWRTWIYGLAAVIALIAVLLVPVLTRAPAPIVQVAVLDLAGTTRGTDGAEIELLKKTWKLSAVESFSSASASEEWEKSWPDQRKKPVVKVIYDRTMGEVRVTGRVHGQSFQKSFSVEQDLQTTLKRVADFIAERTGR